VRCYLDYKSYSCVLPSDAGFSWWRDGFVYYKYFRISVEVAYACSSVRDSSKYGCYFGRYSVAVKITFCVLNLRVILNNTGEFSTYVGYHGHPSQRSTSFPHLSVVCRTVIVVSVAGLRTFTFAPWNAAAVRIIKAVRTRFTIFISVAITTTLPQWEGTLGFTIVPG